MPIPRAYRSDRNAPWNQPEAPECPECGKTITDLDDHTEWCEFRGTPEEIFIHYEEEPPIMEEY